MWSSISRRASENACHVADVCREKQHACPKQVSLPRHSTARDSVCNRAGVRVQHSRFAGTKGHGSSAGSEGTSTTGGQAGTAWGRPQCGGSVVQARLQWLTGLAAGVGAGGLAPGWMQKDMLDVVLAPAPLCCRARCTCMPLWYAPAVPNNPMSPYVLLLRSQSAFEQFRHCPCMFKNQQLPVSKQFHSRVSSLNSTAPPAKQSARPVPHPLGLFTLMRTVCVPASKGAMAELK
jgi:hypothetical protein